MNLEEMDALTNRKKKYQITLCSMMQSTEEAAAPADFPSSAKWISDYVGENSEDTRVQDEPLVGLHPAE